MGIFDFLKKKKKNITEGIYSPPIRNDISIQRKGYKTISEVCLSENKRRKFIEFIDTLIDHNGNDEYMTTLNYVVDFMSQNQMYFIICLDWKEEISNFSHCLNYSLKENFGMEIKLPNQADYGARASVSYDNVFKDFDTVLKKEGFQLSFIDTNSDQYAFVVHKIEDMKRTKMAINDIGYNCLYSDSRKISG